MLKDKFEKLLAKKKSLPDSERKAKMDVVKDLSDDMADHMQKRMGSLKKVSVASDSSEGLKAGLDMAKDKVDDMNKGGVVGSPGHDSMEEPEDEADKYMDAEESPEEEAEESPEEEASEDEENEFHGLDMDALNEKIQKLLEMKKKMESTSPKKD